MGRAKRWLHTRAFSVHPEQIGIGDGFKGASAVALMVCAALVFRQPELAWSAFAAFWTCLADPGGTRHARLWVMSVFVLCGSATAGAVSVIAALGAPVAGAAVFGMIAVSTLGGLRKPRLATVGTLVGVVAVVAIEQPVQFAEAPLVCLLFLGGGVLTIILALGLRPTNPHDAARRGIAGVLTELRDMTAEIAASGDGRPDAEQSRLRLDAEHRRSVRDAIQRARAAIEHAAAGKDDSSALELRKLLTSCDGIFAGLIALSNDPQGRRSWSRDWVCVLADIEAALAAAARQVRRGRADAVALHGTAARIRAHALYEDEITARAIEAVAACIDDLIKPAVAGVVPASIASVLPAGSGSASGREVAANALRRATVVLITYALGHVIALPEVQWATMAAVVVTHPDAQISGPRMIERVLGSLAGGLAAAAAGLLLTEPWELVAAVLPLAAAALALRSVNYTLFVLFLTPLFILVAELVTPGLGQLAATARAMDNVFGSVLALLGCMVLWPERRFNRFAAQLAEAVEANLQFAAAVISPSQDRTAVDVARQRAGLTSTAAEQTLHRLIMPGESRTAALVEARALLAAVRRLAGMATTLHVTGYAAGRDHLLAQMAEVSSGYRRSQI
ncbi:FUSC family protein [Bradyrhizobium sp. DASA03120]|uniref:FUSC family protein n=1 Tax=Bradyrhizobium sp. SMVTL-02 TaxID=3395917 RepID=UPI003F718B2E